MDAGDDLPALPAAVEVAAYRIVVEAVTNIVRHARARHCQVTLALAATALAVTITDDGIGLTACGRYGNGLAIMRERAEELGGTVRVGVMRPPQEPRMGSARELGARWSLVVGGVSTFAVGIAAYRVLVRIDRRRTERREQTATGPAPAGEWLSCRGCTWGLLRSRSRGRAGVGRTSAGS